MAGFDLEEFPRTVEWIRQKAAKEGRLMYNPPDEELRPIVEKEPGLKVTKYGNMVAVSEPMSRAAMFTQNSVDYPFGEAEQRLLTQCEAALATKRLVCVDRVVGSQNSDTVVRLIVPEEFAHVAYGGKNLFAPLTRRCDRPDYTIVMFTDEAFEANKSKPLPQKDITIRLAMLPDGRVVKICRNSNYIGEYKKGVFASEDWAAKTKRGGIFLHAGCREDYLQGVDGKYRTTRTLLAALSANGKTTTSSKVLARKGSEKSWLVQDDGGTLMPDGSFHGFELGGIFVKTEGVNPGDQAEIYYGLLKPGTFGENIHVTEDGDLDFYNLKVTSNSRAVIQRRDFLHASLHIDVEKTDNLVLITRGPLIPAIARLTLEQAVGLMILGQAMESSAGDPTKAGKIRTEFFYDPFLAGDRAAHANLFYEIIKNQPHMRFYLMNTGGIGEGHQYTKIRLEDTLAILEALIRGGIDEWVDSPSGFQVPASVPGVDSKYFHPERFYSVDEFETLQKDLNRLRHETIEKVGGGLHAKIRNVF
ncbi:MAG: phosphoenolpyruvate carboxykinase [Dehalococcoidia bacterium]|nr:phosphoenolpyruvate carboxykinase [Dehalococcoidia bacterium]